MIRIGMSDLEKEVDNLRISRVDFDEHVNELYELRPLLEKCNIDRLLKEYDEADAIACSVTEWYIRSTCLLKSITDWTTMYVKTKENVQKSSDRLHKKIKTLRHAALKEINKS